MPMSRHRTPRAQGLYDPRHEHDACGVGMVADLQGRRTHKLVRDALKVLINLEHRGACGADKLTGDGAGILIQVPDRFLRQVCTPLGIKLPQAGAYAVGCVFLPTDATDRAACEAIFQKVTEAEGQHLLGWRDVPFDASSLGESARAAQPVIRMVFIGKGDLRRMPDTDGQAFERKLYLIRRQVENQVKASSLPQKDDFYIPSLSARTLVYKGLFTPRQLPAFYRDLSEPGLESAMGLVHSRFSTNTFPSWPRAHPYRYISHNGEINTLRGNVNWMTARESQLISDLFGKDIDKLLPIIDQSGSDSAMFDNALELLTLAGRSLPHAVMMMIPEPWTGDPLMDPVKRAFYEYHACLLEPWDGPASIVFTNGTVIGAVLDRNGLRPSRYYVTKDDQVILSSEVGVLDIEPERVLRKGRLQPGRMFLVDMSQGRIIRDEEIKQFHARAHPYGEWLRDNLVSLSQLPPGPVVHQPDRATVLLRQRAFGYTTEDLRIVMAPMAQTANEAVGSMGNDAALAVLSDRPQLLYNYFKQLFAQVTNPPVDSVREEIVMAIETTIGGEGNLLQPLPESARQIRLPSPVISNDELDKLRVLDGKGPHGFNSETLPILYPVAEGAAGLEQALQQLFRAADDAIERGVDFIILSDRGITKELAAIPALLAVAGLHHHLIRKHTRTRVGLILESGEPREVHHFALLIGYGAGAVNPYVAFETLDDMIRQGELPGLEYKKAVANYSKALAKGVVKVMSKMGISTAQSYCGAQIFEAIGLSQAIVDKYFTWTSSRIEGIGLDVIADEVRQRHERAFPDRPFDGYTLDVGGAYQVRSEGEYHLFNPQSIHKLQYAVRKGDYDVFRQYSQLIDNQAKRLCTLRGLFELKPAGPPVPLEEVEPAANILRRFKSGAMSYGSISQEAHETLAIAMNRIGGKSNTGEGGEDPVRYTPDANGDSRNSAIKQVASGRFGVTSEYLVNAQELQIKMAQGAKPGEGGQLPGSKVYPWIAKVRYSTPGVGLISPPPHHDIYSIEDLAELIHDLKNANRHARISVKLVAEVGVGTVAAGVSKAHADVVLISGHDGGTGASPLTSLKHAGAPWEIGLAETHQTLLLNNLRSRIVVEVDGQLKTGRDVIIGALLGAEEFGFATAPLVAMGCIMMRVCHLNTCPVGVATQDPRLREKFAGKPEHVVTFMQFIAEEVRELMASLGFRTFNEMIGRTDCLETVKAISHYKARGIDLTPILRPELEVGPEVGRYQTETQDHGLEESMDVRLLIPLCRPTLEKGKPIAATLPIENVNRVVGTMLGAELTRKYGGSGLPDDTIRLHFQGSAGQSFGAFVPRGITLLLEGDANDYVGKGLSGGKIIVRPPDGSTFDPTQNVIIGNVAFYGATAGEAFINGVAGERFCVRNSGVNAVVLGVGDHGCEYMTGGRVVVLGPIGKNFAAGMSGGIAYVLIDDRAEFEKRCNKEMVTLFYTLDDEDVTTIQDLLRKHRDTTRCDRGRHVLAEWERFQGKFVKVYPNDYRRVIETQKRFKAQGLADEEAVMAAFEQNVRDLARVGGK
jgi:glutamate synthase (ferredoxin)